MKNTIGGDHDNVTIAGQSGGAVNVFSLLVSLRAEGLFQRALAQDGIGANDPRRHAGRPDTARI